MAVCVYSPPNNLSPISISHNLQIKYLLFDCDNTLVLSEDVAFEVCADLVNEIMEKKGLPERYSSEDLISRFIGLTFRRMIAVLQTDLGFQLEKDELENYSKLEEERVIAKTRAKAQPCVGSIDVLAKLHHEGKYKMAVVSSSALRRIRAMLETTGQDKFFDYSDVYSASTSLPTPQGKPSPAIYLYVLELFGANPHECLAIEDSRSGAKASTAAGIPTLGYIGAYHSTGQRQEMVSKFIDLGCMDVMWDWADFEKHLVGIEAMK